MQEIEVTVKGYPAAFMALAVIVAKAMDGDASLAQILPQNKKDELLEIMGAMAEQGANAVDPDIEVSEEEELRRSQHPAIKKWREALGYKPDDENLFIF